MYSDFSNKYKRVEKLTECFEDAEIDYSKILRHAPIRWLSLITCIERIINVWPAIKRNSIKRSHKDICEFIKFQEHEVLDDLEPKISYQECYLYFIPYFMSIFQTYLLKLQKKTNICTELHPIMIS